MSAATFPPHAPSDPFHWVKALGRVMLIVAVIVSGYDLNLALESPGERIRHDLTRAAAEVATLPSLTPRDRVAETVSQYFPRYRATVDATGFPALVSVTLHDLDRAVCRDAYRKADRIEGRVVIAIEGNETACRDETQITWRIMP